MIAPIAFSEVAHRFDWQHVGADVSFDSVATDSRDELAGKLFVAIKGERFDGHDYVSIAAEHGAVGVLTEVCPNIDIPSLVSGDSVQALGHIAQINRERFKGLVLGLTGSAGKTSTKSMIAHILAHTGATLATQGNFNNEIGVPLTLLNIEANHQFAVVEMGAAKVGDIQYLCDFVKPDVGLVTNAVEAHIDGFGSLDAVVKTKGEIFTALAASGTAIINFDSPFYEVWRGMSASNNSVSFGLSLGADVRADNIALSVSESCFDIQFNGQNLPVKLNVLGQHNVMNALAAVACCLVAGMTLGDIVEALATFVGVDSRLSPLLGHADCKVLDDSYNANPTAFKAAIDVLTQAPERTIVVMGEMGELGSHSQAHHQTIGYYARSKGVNMLLSVGTQAAFSSDAFGENGHNFDDKQTLINYLKPQLNAGDTVLVKGSHFTAMDEVVRAISAQQKATREDPINDNRGAPC